MAMHSIQLFYYVSIAKGQIHLQLPKLLFHFHKPLLLLHYNNTFLMLHCPFISSHSARTHHISGVKNNNSPTLLPLQPSSFSALRRNKYTMRWSIFSPQGWLRASSYHQFSILRFPLFWLQHCSKDAQSKIRSGVYFLSWHAVALGIGYSMTLGGPLFSSPFTDVSVYFSFNSFFHFFYSKLVFRIHQVLGVHEE